MGGRCLLPTRTWELEPSYTVIEEGHWKSLRSTQIHGSSGPVSHMLFPQPLPATNIRMLAATPTVRQDAGGFCPVLSSHKEGCLEASCLTEVLGEVIGISRHTRRVPPSSIQDFPVILVVGRYSYSQAGCGRVLPCPQLSLP